MLRDRSSKSGRQTGSLATPPAELPQWLAELHRKAAGMEPHRQIFLKRAVQAVIHLTQLDDESLVRAAASSTDLDVLVRALQSPDALETIEQMEPLASALLEGIAARRELIQEEGGTWTSQEVAGALHITPQAVNKARLAGRLIGLYSGRQGYLYPVWQFAGGQPIAGLKEVLEALSDFEPWSQAIFFLNPNLSLDGRRPLDLLRNGELAPILEAASMVGEHGAV